MADNHNAIRHKTALGCHTLNLDKIQALLFEEYYKNGYAEMWNKAGKIGDVAEMGLVVTEVSEALEEIRRKTTDNGHLAEECVDIIIRTLNFMSRKDLWAEPVLLKKHEKT